MHLILVFLSILLFSYAGQAQMINSTPGFQGVEIINEFDMDNDLTIQSIPDSEAEYELVNNECRRIGGKLGSVSYEV
jgi:hypothetical protein